MKIAMKKSLLAFCATLLLPGVALAAPDFSGSWIRDNGKSEQVSYPLFWLTRGVDPGGRVNGDFILDVQQDARTIKINDPQRPRRVLELDGKARTVPMDTGMQSAAVAAHLSADTLTVVTIGSYGGMPGNVGSKTHEIWSLSPDGKILTIATTRESPATKQDFKVIFNRK